MTNKNLFPLTHQKQISEQEKKLARLFLNKEIDLVEDDFYQKSIERNQALSSLGTFDQFICIGCGPIPSTLFAAEKFSMSAELIGIDLDLEALVLARQVSERLGIEIDFYSSLADIELLMQRRIYYIANLVVGKKEVLEEILEREKGLNGEFVLVVREPTKSGEGHAESLRQKLDLDKFKFELLGEASEIFHSQNYLIKF